VYDFTHARCRALKEPIPTLHRYSVWRILREIAEPVARSRLEAPRLALSVWPHAGLPEVEESGGACGEARGGRGLGKMREDRDLSQLGAFSRN
jgi:hypothetical protein